MTSLPDTVRADAVLLWDYHVLRHPPRRADVGIGLGSHDLGVADHAAALFHEGRFPLLVFTGATAPTTATAFPHGEAVAYRERAVALGVPDEAVLVEPHARNTGENIALTRRLLAEHGVPVRAATLICKPYQQRRALATCRKHWPELTASCSAAPESFDDYLAVLGAERVVNMLVGETQRMTVYAERGFTTTQEVPSEVEAAFGRLVRAGFTARLV
ncbi:hypothetical protein B1813_15345 [Saccharomonospora piscinae]|uniref:DUF218 domain-containing protein n=1 Tax=Saccharomonospora piscinae TaxID=687388 RepID=A0A1V9A1D2_SACPI|nr:YdcF family protein [Saccharomonospora piscinae]OQO90891.1 hypothetical protein B1813_15345 [Saccharomonospora piscinae]